MAFPIHLFHNTEYIIIPLIVEMSHDFVNKCTNLYYYIMCLNQFPDIYVDLSRYKSDVEVHVFNPSPVHGILLIIIYICSHCVHCCTDVRAYSEYDNKNYVGFSTALYML